MTQKWTVEKLVDEYGPKNVRFFLPMSPLQFIDLIPGLAFTSSSTARQVVECEIYEGRYKVSENYKIELLALNPQFGKESWYISDLNTALRYEGSEIRVYILHGDRYTQVPNNDFRY